MKFIKILVFAMLFALMLSMVGCDLSALIGGFDDSDGIGEGGNEITGGNTGDENTDNGGNTGAAPDHVCDYKLDSKTDASCFAEGVEIYKCSCGRTQTKTLEKTAHTEETIPATEPTETSPGKTEGKKCSVCGEILVKAEYVFEGDYATVEKYDGDYAYNSLAKLAKGEMLTKLYNSIDEIADEFHKSNVSVTEEDEYIIGKVNFAELGLTADEAIAVWSAYRIDRPLYYWISGNVLYSNSEINIVCDEEYADSATRTELNNKIYLGVQDYVEEAYSNTKYNTVLGFHDLIILAIDYAYEADGVTPEDDVWAHNVIGAFDKGAGVCESYAKTFQLLLNYCDVENIFVTGWANEAHAWNLVQLDDGKWYWCDLTWDDTPDFAWGISYQYFCVTDSENVGWTYGPFTMAASTFTSSHIPNGRVDTGTGYSYELPARATSKFSGAEIMLRDTFNVGSLTFAVAGFNSVQLVAVNANGNIDIPATVTYKGVSLPVIAVGKMEDGRFTVGSIASYKVGAYTEQYTVGAVNIPDSVIFIWDDAFNMDALESITVSEGNTEYASLDGVLFSKDLSVLIKYPTAKSGKSYTLPTETVKIAAGAFATLYSNTNDKLKLEEIYLVAAEIAAGVRNYGYGYENARYFESNPWDRIAAVLSGAATVHPSSAAA